MVLHCVTSLHSDVRHYFKDNDILQNATCTVKGALSAIEL